MAYALLLEQCSDFGNGSMLRISHAVFWLALLGLVGACHFSEREAPRKSDHDSQAIATSGLASGSSRSSISPKQLPGAVGWGLDACLSRHVPGGAFEPYTGLVGNSEISILRERDIGRRIAGIDAATLLRDLIFRSATYENDPRPAFRKLKAQSYAVGAFATLPNGVVAAQADNVLPEDLLAVYREGQILVRDFHGLVDAWEMVGEPDLGHCRDLPDRVAAYQKALYLGIRHGAEAIARRDPKPQSSAIGPLVLMGALGCPPGPWLERAARNGLLDYTDAYNFHFYGHAEDLTEEMAGHRAFARRWGRPGIPLWITECGINAVTPDDFLNPQRRQLQAEFTVATARQALATDDVAVFMPFILVHDKDPYAMTLSADRPLPAWEAYAQFTKENPWPSRTVAMPPRDPNPIVVQWLPDNETTIPHKVSGTYRFKGDQPIKGELRIYNFSDRAIHGKLVGPSPDLFSADYTNGMDDAERDLAVERQKEAQKRWSACRRGQHDPGS